MTSIMLGVKVDRDEPLELHQQVAGEIRRAKPDELIQIIQQLG